MVVAVSGGPHRPPGEDCAELGKRELAASESSLSRIVLLVDDYDILLTSGTQPLGAFLPYLAYGGDIGLHVLMTRRVIGASRGYMRRSRLGCENQAA